VGGREEEMTNVAMSMCWPGHNDGLKLMVMYIQLEAVYVGGGYYE
jgi:hypothetical protein